MLNKFKKDAIVYAKIFSLLASVFSLLMVCQALIPNRAIINNANNSLHYISNEAPKGQSPIINNNKIDDFTDDIMIRLSITGTYIKEVGRDEESSSVNRIQEAFYNGSYSRYWHGYLIFLKPLLIFFSIDSIRNIMVLIFLVILCLTVFEIAKKISKIVAFMFLASLSMVGVWMVMINMNPISTFLIMLIATILVIKFDDKKKDNSFFCKLFFIVGGITTFFDLLVTPAITIGMPLTILLIKRIRKDKSPKTLKYIYSIASNSVAWLFGYIMLWASKWFIASIVLGRNEVSQAINQLLYRVGGESTDLSTVIDMNTNMPLFRTIICAACIAFILNLILNRNRVIFMKKTIPFIVMAMFPFVWISVLKEHSHMHFWFVFRNMMITAFASMIIIYINTKDFFNLVLGKFKKNNIYVKYLKDSKVKTRINDIINS